MRGGRAALILGVIAAVEAAVLIGIVASRWVRRPEADSEVRAGARVAGEAGCFACHGPGGTGRFPNPGAVGSEVPGFVGGTPMMYAQNDAELAQYISSGMPDRRKGDETYLRARKAALLQMPAYGGKLSTLEIRELVAWVKAVSGLAAPASGIEQEGFELARANGCFGCHGPMGSGGTSNPGSFKGNIPGWTGSDFEKLARNDEEIRDWIRTGGTSRLTSNPAARHFLTGEVIRMPAFRERFNASQLDALVALIHFLRAPRAPAEATH